MNDDAIKKQRPNDGSYIGNSQNEDDEYGLKEYGYDLDKNKKDETDKRKKSGDEEDGDEDSKMRKEDEEYNKRLDELEKARKAREEQREEKAKRIREEIEERKKKKKEREEKSNREKEEKKQKKVIAGQEIQQKKVFSHKKEEGVFRHKKLMNFNTGKKIDKALKKIHGISLKKKQKFVELLKSYNPNKTTLRKKDFDDFVRRFKSKRFTGPNFDKMKKKIDLKSARKEFGKRDLDKLRRGITGEEDPHKYQRRTSTRGSSNSRVK